MKRLLCLILCLLLALPLAACGGETTREPEEPVSEMDRYLEAIAANKDAWIDDEFKADNRYAVMDMDFNGRPEIYRSSCRGENLVSSTMGWEACEGEGGIAELSSVIGGPTSDLSMYSRYICYNLDGTDYIVTEDWDKDGPYTHYVDKKTVWLKEGYLGEDYIAGFTASAAEDGSFSGYIKEYCVDGQVTDAAGYVAAENSLFSTSQATRVMNIGWFMLDKNKDELTETDVLASIKESWAGFGLTEYDLSAELGDPGEGFDEFTEAAPNPSDIMDHWYLYSTELEGDQWLAEEINLNGVLSFSEKTASFTYESDSVNLEFKDMEFTQQEGELYPSCGNDQWYFSFSDASGNNEFAATITQPGVVQMLWYNYEGIEEDSYPSVCLMVFYNGL